jgi:23S rRNA (uracil1939-C5)-methyltransferase
MTSKPHTPAAIRLAKIDELELDIEKLVAGGEGFGRYEGIPIFVPRSAPGDRLRVRVTERRTDYGRGEIVEILEPGPGRRQPPCSHFGNCGGCDLQHLEDGIQTELKAEAVRETLERLAGLDSSQPVEVIAGRSWGYRLRTQLHIEREEDRAVVGYHARRSPRCWYRSSRPFCHGSRRCLPRPGHADSTWRSVVTARCPAHRKWRVYPTAS